MNPPPVLVYRIAQPIAEAESAVREALKAQGFGILTEVDVAVTFREKLGLETKPHRILGACNPKLAHASLEAEPSVGAFLPCGVDLREGASPGETIVTIQNPALLATVFDATDLAPLAEEVLAKLEAALKTVSVNC